MLTFYIKPTNYCNIDCEHCYLPIETRQNKLVMTDETLLSIASMALDLKEKEGHGQIHFIWHGGEPLILSPKWYVDAFEKLDSLIGRDNYTNSLQTSLVPYRNEWNALIKDRFDSWIGSSIDFTQRKVKSSSENYLDLWMKKVELARSNGFYVMPGMVPTINEIDKADEILDWFIENGFTSFNVDRYSRYGNENNIDWPTNKNHADFLINLFDAVMARKLQGKPVPYVNVIAGGINGVLHDMPSDRWGTKCQREFLVIEPDGNLNSCPDRALHESPFSNIQDGSDALINSKGRRKWIRMMNIDHKEDHCLSCEFRSFCASGCPVTPNGPRNGQSECSGYKSYLLHVQDFCSISDHHLEIADQYAQLPINQ
jgi:radical SAM protein with 4Fe4S-binding SPASM domain